MYPGALDPKQAGGLESGGVASLLSLAQAGAGAAPPNPGAFSAHAAAAAALAGRPRSHSGASVLSAASSHGSAATAAGADYYHLPPHAQGPPPPPPPPGYGPPPPYGHPLYHHPHATGAGYPHHPPMHPAAHHYGPSGLKAQAPPLPGPYARAALPTYVPSAAAGGGGGTHQGVWSSELRAEYRGWLQVNRGISKETSITYSHAVHGVLKELVLKRIRDGRVGLPTHGMNARELQALIEEQPLEAERIIKRDKRSSYFRYLKEFLGMPMDDAPGGASGGSALPTPAPSARSGGVKRPAPSSGASTASSQPATSLSASASSGSQPSSQGGSMHHSAASSLAPSASTATAATGGSSGAGSAASDAAALLLLEEEEAGSKASGGNGPVVCWSAAVRGEYLAWLQEPASKGGWGLTGGAEEAVNYVRTGHVLIRKVLADALGRADYQAMDKPALGRALQSLIDAQPGLLARVIKGPKNRRLFQPLQRFFGLTNTNGTSASSNSNPPSASSSPIPSYAYASAPPPHGVALPAASVSAGSSSAASSRSSSPSRSSLSGSEPVWADALKSAYRRWLELDRGFGAATVQNYVHSAVQTLRALVDLRLRRGQGQPASRLTASEAAALLKDLGAELPSVGVDVSQSHFRCLRSFLFGTTGMQHEHGHDEDEEHDDSDSEAEYPGHRDHGQDEDEDEEDDMIIVSAARHAAAARAPVVLARPSPERPAKAADAGGNGSCKGCRELQLDLGDARGECAQWRGRCEALAERVRELERALAQAQAQGQPPHHKRVAGLLASSSNSKSPAGSPFRGPAEAAGGVKGSPLVLAGEQERKEQEEDGTSSVGSSNGDDGAPSRHPKKMRFRGPSVEEEGGHEGGHGADGGEGSSKEGNNQLLSSSSSSASASSGAGGMSHSVSGNKLASLLSAINDDSAEAEPAKKKQGGKGENEVEPAPMLVSAVRA